MFIANGTIWNSGAPIGLRLFTLGAKTCGQVDRGILTLAFGAPSRKGVTMRPLQRTAFPSNRKFVLGAMRAGHRATPMTALVNIDVSDTWQRIEAEKLSPTGLILACVGRAVAAHPEVHAYRDFVGRLVTHQHVDVATMIEVPTSTGPFALAHPVRDTDLRTVTALSDELRQVRAEPAVGRSGRLLLRWGQVAGRMPGLVSLFYFFARRSAKVRSGIGTVAVSSVGMMTGGSGFVIGSLTVASISITVGGATERPWVVDGEVVVRRLLDLTVQIDHRVVDGAPAARFGATLRNLLENPELVDW